ncbi:hypothetical protein WJX73_005767 [Symbiochloris irregularis]|uniref:Uncharacterized protein n=1 Tax=Symbiochloris irregularis TaxID=706552 RepID=A0AAW1NQ92_9CHLO
MFQEYVEVPRIVQGLTRGAGVWDKVPWDGQLPPEVKPSYALERGTQKRWFDWSDSSPEEGTDQPAQRTESWTEEDSAAYMQKEIAEAQASLAAKAAARDIEAGLIADGIHPNAVGQSDPLLMDMQGVIEADEAIGPEREDWEVTVEEMREVDDLWAEAQAKYPSEKSLEGMIFDGFREPRPAPDWDPEAQKLYDSFEWLTWRIHRALGDAGNVDRAANDLASAGLLNEDVVFRDGVAQRLAGACQQGEHFWCHNAKGADSAWTLVHDCTMTFPYPAWYRRYLKMQLQPSLPWVGHGSVKEVPQSSPLARRLKAAGKPGTLLWSLRVMQEQVYLQQLCTAAEAGLRVHSQVVVLRCNEGIGDEDSDVTETGLQGGRAAMAEAERLLQRQQAAYGRGTLSVWDDDSSIDLSAAPQQIYTMDKSTGKVGSVEVQIEYFTGLFLGEAFGGLQDALELYLIMLGLHQQFDRDPAGIQCL